MILWSNRQRFVHLLTTLSTLVVAFGRILSRCASLGWRTEEGHAQQSRGRVDTKRWDTYHAYNPNILLVKVIGRYVPITWVKILRDRL